MGQYISSNQEKKIQFSRSGDIKNARPRQVFRINGFLVTSLFVKDTGTTLHFIPDRQIIGLSFLFFWFFHHF